jgi:hypothetical protein
MTKEVTKPYLEHRFDPKRNDRCKTQPDSNASFRHGESGHQVRRTNPQALFLWQLNILKIRFDAESQNRKMCVHIGKIRGKS